MAQTTIREEQIEGLSAGKITSGTFADARIAASNVTQHQAALSITESQISDLGTYYASGGTDVAVADGGTGASTAAGARTNLGLVIGTDVQAYDANLPTWPATVDATEVGYLNGVTSSIQTQLNAKAPLASPTFTGTATIPAQSSSPNNLGNLGATEAIDWSTGTYFYGTLDSNVTITHTNETEGQSITLVLTYDGVAQRTITWSDVDEWANGSAPIAPTSTSQELIVTLLKIGTTVYGFHNSDVFGGLDNIVEDTTPQLGGELDAQDNTIGFTMQTATGDGTTTIDWRNGNHFDFTFGAFNETFTFTAPSKPCVLTLSLKQDTTGSRTATWPASVKWPGGTAPTLTTTGSTGYDIISFRYDGTNYYGVASLDFS